MTKVAAPLTEHQRRAGAVLIVLFLAAVVTPLLYLAGSALAGSMIGDQSPGILFLALATSPEGPFQLLQKALLPIATGLSIPVIWAEKGRLGYILLGLASLGLLSAITLWIHLRDPESAANLWQISEIEGLDNAKTFATASGQYLLAQFESFLTFALVIVGVKQVS